MIYASVKHRLTVGVVAFIEALKDWDVVPLSENGEVIGGVLLKRNELHVGCGKKPRGSTKQYINQTLNVVIKQYGHAITTVQAENKIGLRFCERLGFVKVGEENGTIRLRCDRSNYKC